MQNLSQIDSFPWFCIVLSITILKICPSYYVIVSNKVLTQHAQKHFIHNTSKFV